MNTTKIKTYLEVSTNLAVLLVALLVLGTFALNLFGRHHITTRMGLVTGQYFPQVTGIEYGRPARTVLIAMSTRCHFCTESMPFYKHLAETQHGRNNAVRIVGVFPEDKSSVEQYLVQHQLSIESISGVDFTSLNIAGTPTIVLIDNSGRIINFWTGHLSKEAEQEVIKTTI